VNFEISHFKSFLSTRKSFSQSNTTGSLIYIDFSVGIVSRHSLPTLAELLSTESEIHRQGCSLQQLAKALSLSVNTEAVNIRAGSSGPVTSHTNSVFFFHKVDLINRTTGCVT